MEGREGLTGGSKCPRCKAVSQPVCEALQSRCPCRDRAGKYWRREPQVDGMKDGGEGGLPRQSGKKPFTAGCVNRMEDRKGETYLEAKRKALPLQKKKKMVEIQFCLL